MSLFAKIKQIMPKLGLSLKTSTSLDRVMANQNGTFLSKKKLENLWIVWWGFIQTSFELMWGRSAIIERAGNMPNFSKLEGYRWIEVGVKNQKFCNLPPNN